VSAPLRIRSFDIARLDIPLFSPFGIAGGAQAVANNVLATVTLEDGTRGYGEAAPLPPYNGETQADALRALEPARTWLVGRDARDWRRMGEEQRRQAPVVSGSAVCALETALLDAVTRHDGMPLWQVFGPRPTALETDMTVTTGSAEEAAAGARDIRARGIRTIKVKVGGPGGPAKDLARVRAIHEVAPDSPLVLDGNAGLDRAAAAELVRGLKTAGIAPALLEQWLPKQDLAGMRALGAESGWLVAADESVTSKAEAERVVAERAAGVINIKLMKAGLAVAHDIVTVAQANGVGLMIGGNVESVLTMSTSACFAAGCGGFTFADLDTPLFLAENPFEGGYVLDGGTIRLERIRAGHGVVPRAG
jgi:L-alanine-DL-glutamate epimerase-like enolase superfamily enzyme